MRFLSAPILLAASSLTTNVYASPDCANIRADGIKWDLRPLKGRHSVWEKDDSDATNTTYTFDLCATLGNRREKDETGCRHGSWACAFQHDYDPDTKTTLEKITASWSIAGTFETAGGATGGRLDDHYQRIKGSNAGDEEEGVRLIYHGGHHDKYPIRFIAAMICDKEKQQTLQRRQETSLAWNLISRNPRERSDSDNDDEESEVDSGLEFKSYKVEPIPGGKKNEENWVLRINWKTVHACEDQADKYKAGGGHWGFFTWFIIILFLLVAAYLIFGSWLNYNRHGARGWDLLPHGDTIRDIPYLLKDWGRAVVDTVQGTHTRGGYNQI